MNPKSECAIPDFIDRIPDFRDNYNLNFNVVTVVHRKVQRHNPNLKSLNSMLADYDKQYALGQLYATF